MIAKNNSKIDNGFILIVDDSSAQRNLLKYFLESNNYKVISAIDGENALEVIDEITPSLIITDIVMPNMNGYELCKRIKSKKNTADVPVILLTVLSSSDDMVKGIACGADSFITKPYSQQYLITLVENTIERSSPANIHHNKINLPINTNGKEQSIPVDPAKIISLMMSAYESALIKNNELMRTQEELKALNDHLGDLVSARTSELSKLNSEKDKFLSIIAHDLKSPFQGLLGLTGLLAQDPESLTLEEISTLGKNIHNSASTLLRLLNNLLEWAQMQKGAINFEPQVTNLFQLVSQNVDIINHRAIQKSITIENTILDSHRIFADESMTNTIIRNLLSNAVKFTNRMGKIIVDSKKLETDFIQISISDNGIGISHKDLNKLFKIEEKVRHKGTDGEESTGLGLLLCKEFVERQGGKIWAESKESIGTTFYFTLPSAK